MYLCPESLILWAFRAFSVFWGLGELGRHQSASYRGDHIVPYELIYLTYIVPEKLSHTDLLFRLDLSSRQYYRLREEAISIWLWSVPEEELGRLVGLVEVLDS